MHERPSNYDIWFRTVAIFTAIGLLGACAQIGNRTPTVTQTLGPAVSEKLTPGMVYVNEAPYVNTHEAQISTEYALNLSDLIATETAVSIQRSTEVVVAITEQAARTQEVAQLPEICQGSDVWLYLNNVDTSDHFTSAGSSGTLIFREKDGNSGAEVYYFLVAKHHPDALMNIQGDKTGDDNDIFYDPEKLGTAEVQLSESDGNGDASIILKTVNVIPVNDMDGNDMDVAIVALRSMDGDGILPDFNKALGVENLSSFSDQNWNNIFISHRPNSAGIDKFVTTQIDSDRVFSYHQNEYMVYPKSKLYPQTVEGSSSGKVCGVNEMHPNGAVIGINVRKNLVIDSENIVFAAFPGDIQEQAWRGINATRKLLGQK